VFKKSASGLCFGFFEAFIGLNALQGLQITTGTKKLLTTVFLGKFRANKPIFGKLRKSEFSGFTPKPLPIADF